MSTSTLATLPTIGARVAIPVHTDAWMTGYRYGYVLRHAASGYTHVRATDSFGQTVRTIKLVTADYGIVWGTI